MTTAKNDKFDKNDKNDKLKIFIQWGELTFGGEEIKIQWLGRESNDRKIFPGEGIDVVSKKYPESQKFNAKILF